MKNAQTRSMYAGIDQVMRQTMKQSIGSRKLTPEQAQAMEQLPSRFGVIMREELSWSAMKP